MSGVVSESLPGACLDPATTAEPDGSTRVVSESLPGGVSRASAEVASPEAPASNGSDGFRKSDERTIHTGHVIRLTEATFSAPDGRHFTRDVVRHSGAVAVVAIEDDEVVLVRQFRAPLAKEVLEIPAGKCDVEGEPPQQTARRELAEEAGIECDSIEELGWFYNSPGFTDELSRVFLATGLRSVPTQRQGVEEQWMTLVRVRLDEVVPMIKRGEICDGKTVIGLLLALQCLCR